LLEPEAFSGKHVLVVGGGNSAADCVLALALSGVCASVSLSYRRPELARLRGDSRERIEALVSAGRIEKLLPTEVVDIGERTVTLRRPNGEEESIDNDAVIVQIGGTAPVELLAEFGIATVEKRAER
jgi:thioredoxin reductase (NADPH)